VLAVHVYEDERWEEELDAVVPGAGCAVLGQDRRALAQAAERLRFTADGLCVNDRPARPRGQALRTWLAGRELREAFRPAAGHRYPHLR
jgi:1-pyrroline-5-carboxylate dehydrogenase